MKSIKRGRFGFNSLSKKWLMVIAGFFVCFLVYDFVAGGAASPANSPTISLIPEDELVTVVTPTTNDVELDADKIASANPSQFYSAYRLEREKVRSRQIELLDNIVNNSNSTAEARAAAQASQLAMIKAMNQEIQLENLLKAKDFTEAAVFIQESNVTIVVNGTLDTTAAAKIADLVKSTIGISMDNVVVMQKD